MKKVLIALIIILAILLAVSSFFGIKAYNNYQNKKSENERLTQSILQSQKEEIQNTKLEVENLKQDMQNKPDCGKISLDRMAPGYTFADLQKFTDQLNSNGLTKKLGDSDIKYLYDDFYASQWKTVMPECESYINSLVESRKINIKQENQDKKIERVLDQQDNLLKYNQCLTTNDESFCQFLLYQ